MKKVLHLQKSMSLDHQEVGLILHIITETDSLRALMSDRKGAKFVKKL